MSYEEPAKRSRKRHEGTRRKVKRGEQDARQSTCSAPDCGRPAYARKLCQTHHRHLLTKGKVGTIRPYRKRSADTVKFAGLRVTPECAERVRRYADRKDLSEGAAIAEILQKWLVKERHPVPPRAP